MPFNDKVVGLVILIPRNFCGALRVRRLCEGRIFIGTELAEYSQPTRLHS